MLSYNVTQSSSLKLEEILQTCSYNSSIPLGSVKNLFKRRFKRAQKCSMGFKSGDGAGRWRSWNGYDASHPCTILLVCFESLSCWNTNLFRTILYYWIVDHAGNCTVLNVLKKKTPTLFWVNQCMLWSQSILALMQTILQYKNLHIFPIRTKHVRFFWFMELSPPKFPQNNKPLTKIAVGILLCRCFIVFVRHP